MTQVSARKDARSREKSFEDSESRSLIRLEWFLQHSGRFFYSCRASVETRVTEAPLVRTCGGCVTYSIMDKNVLHTSARVHA